MSSIEAEQQRVAIFEKLVEQLGPEQAKYIMANHPPGGWEQLATKQDLKALEDSTEKALGGFEKALGGFATKEDLKRFATKEDLKRFATKEDLKRFATKEDLKALEEATKKNLEVGLSTVRAETREGFAAVQVVLAGMVAQSGKTSERRASVFYANFLTLLVLCVAIVSVVVSLN